MKYKITKQFLYWIMGWSYILDGLVIVCSLGLCSLDMSLYTQSWYLDYCECDLVDKNWRL